jgi:hypothetical protein
VPSHLEYALRYAALGIPVMPLFEPDPSGGCTCHTPECRRPGKHPRNRHGLTSATTDPDTIHRWWTTWPGANIGGRTGIAFDVCDIDGPEGVNAVRALLGASHGEVPVVRTGSGGWHLIFAPTGHGNRTRFLPGTDWRGAGGYVVLPPSRHATGHTYRYARGGPHRPPLAPEALLRALCPPRPERPSEARFSPVAGPRRYGATALEREAEKVATATEGGRNEALNRAAFKLGQLIAAGHLTEPDVTDALNAAAHEEDLEPDETRRTVASGLAAGRKHPRTARTA